MKLWVDDIRVPPEGWLWAKTAREAIDILASLEIDEVSLDHDLGEPIEVVGSGYEVACFLEERAVNGLAVPSVIRIHSANPVGRQQMTAAIESIQRLTSCIQRLNR